MSTQKDGISKKRKLPEWMLTVAASKTTTATDEEEGLGKVIANAELALEILEEYSNAREARAEWNMYDYLGQEEEDNAYDNDEDDFNLSDTDVAGNMSTDEAVAAILIAQSSSAPYPYKTDRIRLMDDLRSAITLLSLKRECP